MKAAKICKIKFRSHLYYSVSVLDGSIRVCRWEVILAQIQGFKAVLNAPQRGMTSGVVSLVFGNA